MKLLNPIQIETVENVDINMSPLIDMVFLLLIFFMATAVFVEETGVQVEKPTASTAVYLDKHSIMLAITENGRIFYAGEDVDLNEVRGLISGLVEGADVPVILLADTAAPAGVLVDLIDECKLGGAKQVNVAAVQE